ncbi:hypothetical protein LCGC14_0581690 [marine sediment metagenome]|uniref:N-acetylmuramoyl-L-alanine amidase n=1 Tax=marine sediment metagenome TaxID=412755 RepID=A0A0F9RL69_9ZZZZ
MAELWYPKARRPYGPDYKVSGPPQAKKGAVYHSMVSSYASAYGKLLGPAESSWHFSVRQNGAVMQHYPVTAWAWHCGDRDDPAGEISNNRDLIGIEHEGGPIGNESEPLTSTQLTATVELTAWLYQQGHIANLSQIGDNKGLWEHHEIVATACPSHRIPRRLIRTRVERILTEEEDMSEVLNELKAQEKFRKIQAVHVAIGALRGAGLPTDLKNVMLYLGIK